MKHKLQSLSRKVLGLGLAMLGLRGLADGQKCNMAFATPDVGISCRM